MMEPRYTLRLQPAHVRVLKLAAALYVKILKGDFNAAVTTFTNYYTLSTESEKSIRELLTGHQKAYTGRESAKPFAIGHPKVPKDVIGAKMFSTHLEGYPFVYTYDESEMNTLWRASELFSRVLMGELPFIAQVAGSNLKVRPNDNVCWALHMQHDIEAFTPLLTGFPERQYHGVHSPKISEDARIAYDVVQAMRHGSLKRNRSVGPAANGAFGPPPPLLPPAMRKCLPWRPSTYEHRITPHQSQTFRFRVPPNGLPSMLLLQGCLWDR